MWLSGDKDRSHIGELFTPDAVYIEYDGTMHDGVGAIANWIESFFETRTTTTMDVGDLIPRGENDAVITWRFEHTDKGDDEDRVGYDGAAIVTWAPDGRICRVQEYGQRGSAELEVPEYAPVVYTEPAPGDVSRETCIAAWTDAWTEGIMPIPLSAYFSEDAKVLPATGEVLAGYDAIAAWIDGVGSSRPRLDVIPGRIDTVGDQSILEWHVNLLDPPQPPHTSRAYEGMTILRWAPDNRISYAKEFGRACTDAESNSV